MSHSSHGRTAVPHYEVDLLESGLILPNLDLSSLAHSNQHEVELV